jgi:hypothetical protein
VVEPQISAHLQIARFLRLGVDFGYRIVAGVDTFETRDFHDACWTRGLSAEFGVDADGAKHEGCGAVLRTKRVSLPPT